MTNLAQDWDNFVQHEKDMMATALDWYSHVNGNPETPVALIPFLDRKKVTKVIGKYIDAFINVIDSDKDTHQWRRLHNYLKYGPHVRRQSKWEKVDTKLRTSKTRSAHSKG